MALFQFQKPRKGWVHHGFNSSGGSLSAEPCGTLGAGSWESDLLSADLRRRTCYSNESRRQVHLPRWSGRKGIKPKRIIFKPFRSNSIFLGRFGIWLEPIISLFFYCKLGRYSKINCIFCISNKPIEFTFNHINKSS